MFDDYYSTCQRVIKVFGKTRRVEGLGPSDFLVLKKESSEKRRPVSVENGVARVRVLFNYLWAAGLVDKPPRLAANCYRRICVR
jgi:hypothetical protein